MLTEEVGPTPLSTPWKSVTVEEEEDDDDEDDEDDEEDEDGEAKGERVGDAKEDALPPPLPPAAALLPLSLSLDAAADATRAPTLSITSAGHNNGDGPVRAPPCLQLSLSLLAPPYLLKLLLPLPHTPAESE